MMTLIVQKIYCELKVNFTDTCNIFLNHFFLWKNLLTEDEWIESESFSTGGCTHRVTLLYSLELWSLGEPWGVGMGVAAVCVMIGGLMSGAVFRTVFSSLATGHKANIFSVRSNKCELV